MSRRTLIMLAVLLPVIAVADPGTGMLSNPQISLILDGVAYADDVHGTGNEWLDEAAGISHAHAANDHEHGGLEEGFNLREAEVVMSATVDQVFDGYANLALSAEGLELEEAYFTTRTLPAGWQLKGGKFFSGFGYANSRHPHSWDFVDQNLAYLSLVGGHGLNDTGLQVTWSPATETWVQFGIEALQGHEQEKFGSAVDVDQVAAALLDELAIGTGDAEADGLPTVARRGVQLFTGFLKFAPDLGATHALQLGASFAVHNGQQEMHEEGDPVTDIFYADGESTLLGLEAVYKRSATGRNGKGALRVSAEYLALRKDLEIAYHTTGSEIGEALTGTQDAFYLQGVYGFAPRWEAGLRHDVTGMSSEVTEGGVTTGLDASSRTSAVLAFRPSEFSLLRLQVAGADMTDNAGSRQNPAQVMLQYNMSLGAHGAHAF